MSEPSSANADGSRLPTLGPRGEGWFVLQIVLLAAIFIAGFVVNTQWSGSPRIAISVVGVALIIAGLALAFLGIRDLDRSLSPMPRPTDTAVLIKDGIYRRLRHPIYAGLILLGVGYSLIMASLLALALTLILALILDLKARREEVWLRERYPGYAEYATHTKRFVPGIY